MSNQSRFKNNLIEFFIAKLSYTLHINTELDINCMGQNLHLHSSVIKLHLLSKTVNLMLKA